VVGCWHGYLSRVRSRPACGPADAAAAHCLIASVKYSLPLPFWYCLTRVVPDKEPLNGFCCCCFVVVVLLLLFCCCVVMVALWNRADHYIFALWFLSSSIFFLSSPNLSRRLDVYHTSTRGVALLQIWNAGLKCAASG